MSGFQCPSCGNPSRDGGLCEDDTKRLRDTLTAAPGLLDDLDTSASRQSVHSTGKGARSAERPLPVNFKASELRDGYAALLVSWAMAVGDEGDPTLQGGGRECAHWLLYNLAAVRVHEAADAILDEIVTQARACWRAVDAPLDLVPLGECGAPIKVSGDPCLCSCQHRPHGPGCDLPGGCGSLGCVDGWRTYEVRCDRRLTVEVGQTVVTCRNCSTTHDVRRRRDEALGDSAYLEGLPSQLAGVLTALGMKCSAAMIRGFAARGRIKAKHTDGVRTWYRLGDVHEAWLASREPEAKAS